MAIEQDTFSDPFGGVLCMKLTGKKYVGFAEFYLEGSFIGSQVMPENPWQILQLLVDYSKVDPIYSFLTAKEMVVQLSRRYGVQTDGQNLIRTIWRLRGLLRESVPAGKLVSHGLVESAKEFSNRLIQHLPQWGYRLTLPSSNITTAIQDVA